MADRICKTCMAPLPPKNRGKPQLYCSIECRQRKSPVVCHLRKPCSACGVVKSVHEFGRLTRARDGHQGRCIECYRLKKRVYNRQHVASNREHYRNKGRERSRRIRREGRRNLLLHQFYDARRRHGYTGSLEEYSDHIERLRMGCPQSSWSAWETKERSLAVSDYIEAATEARKPSEVNGRRYWPEDWSAGDRYRWRYNNDPEYRLRERLRRQFAKWLSGERKSRPAFLSCVGYGWRKLRQHIELQFEPGMSWDNAGEWHVDHIMPKKLFDPSNPDEVRVCWDLPNLRPMWAEDNHRKLDRVEYLL